MIHPRSAARDPSRRSRRAPREIDPIYRINVRAIVRFLRTQPPSFWLLNFYFFIEYVRPQQVWTSLDVLPWGVASLGLTTIAVLAEGRTPRFRTKAGLALLAYSVVLVLSSVTAINPAASYAGWQLYFSWVLVYFLVTSTITTERRLLVFTVAFLLYSFKMSQHGFRSWVSNGFGFSDWGVTGGHAWFANSGELGIQMCIFLPLSVEFILALRQDWSRLTRWFFYLMPITAVGTIVASSSRGALLGAAAVGLWWVLRSKHRIRSLVAVAALAALTWVVVPEEQKARFSTAGEDETSVSRLVRWEAGIQMAQEYPVLGIGYNNWLTFYGPLSHNIFIEALSEMGYTGLFAFLALIGATFHVNFRTRRLMRSVPGSSRLLTHMAHGLDGALIGFLVSGFFVTVLYYPFFWINLAMSTAVHLTAQREQARVAHGRATGAIRPVVRLPGGRRPRAGLSATR